MAFSDLRADLRSTCFDHFGETITINGIDYVGVYREATGPMPVGSNRVERLQPEIALMNSDIEGVTIKHGDPVIADGKHFTVVSDPKPSQTRGVSVIALRLI